MSANDTGVLVAMVRGYRGLTQVQLSKMSGVPYSYISRFENGAQSLTDLHMAALEKALRVNFNAIRPAFEQFAAAMGNGNGGGLQDADAPAPAPEAAEAAR